MFNSVPKMRTVCKRVECYNPISGHRWSEDGEISGYDVTGGGWMRTSHSTLKGAEKELTLRNKICKERVARGQEPNIT